MPSLLACFVCGGKGESDDVRVLDYRHSALSDVPADVFASERTLEELLLDSNQLTELPRQLFYCHGLRELGLSDNELTSLPPAVASLINLTSIDLSKNAISDIPDNIKGCKQLAVVDASINPLCRLPEGFTQLLSLQELYLNDTFLEYLPANFGRLSKLKILELRENQLNTLPKSIARLTNLQRLDIGQNDFSELPEVIGSLGNLTELLFDNNKVKSLPPMMGKLKKLLHVIAMKAPVDTVTRNTTSLPEENGTPQHPMASSEGSGPLEGEQGGTPQTNALKSPTLPHCCCHVKHAADFQEASVECLLHRNKCTGRAGLTVKICQAHSRFQHHHALHPTLTFGSAGSAAPSSKSFMVATSTRPPSTHCAHHHHRVSSIRPPLICCSTAYLLTTCASLYGTTYIYSSGHFVIFTKNARLTTTMTNARQPPLRQGSSCENQNSGSVQRPGSLALGTLAEFSTSEPAA
ncbi:hypothetical protein C7M84_017818 [Penaeus vannamei]|uniref:Disease resistance R13L4/SHOC-2-like LRR domain-containing protein n=1 Tax=Penaeus vannamei TaxID=6689 RepID=A0A423SJ11_PENVA|nr:hypothetical protein C7M84_017818 [Penaeus vannamei]